MQTREVIRERTWQGSTYCVLNGALQRCTERFGCVPTRWTRDNVAALLAEHEREATELRDLLGLFDNPTETVVAPEPVQS